MVCSGLQEALGLGIADGLRGVLEEIDSAIAEYQPESLIVLGALEHGVGESALAGMSRRWGKNAKLQLVCSSPDVEARAFAEALGSEVHNELIWGRYRFRDHDEDGALDLKLISIVGQPNYSIKVGRGKLGDTFTGMKLAVYLKGLGKLVLPSVSPKASSDVVFQAGLERCDVFAVGHQRVLPLGKVCDLKPLQGKIRSVPIIKTSLGARKRGNSELL
jgi:hypothetical protein